MHSFLSEYDNVKACFKYKIPFYSIFKPICYINPLKSSGVEVVFWNALKMKNSLPLLDQKTRKPENQKTNGRDNLSYDR
ncbi:MAG: hypothetical protein HOI49_00490 [Bacteroidetes bacterium]|nr:hypothetical protein [Bacteroidota bacterium]